MDEENLKREDVQMAHLHDDAGERLVKAFSSLLSNYRASIRIPKFDNNVHPVQFVDDVEQYLKGIDIPGEKEIFIIKNLIDGKVRLWFDIFGENIKNFTEFRKKFLEEFHSPLFRVTYKHRWYARKYNPESESIRTYFYKQVYQAKFFDPPLSESEVNYRIIQQFPYKIRIALVTVNYTKTEAVSQYLERLEFALSNCQHEDINCYSDDQVQQQEYDCKNGNHDSYWYHNQQENNIRSNNHFYERCSGLIIEQNHNNKLYHENGGYDESYPSDEKVKVMKDRSELIKNDYVDHTMSFLNENQMIKSINDTDNNNHVNVLVGDKVVYGKNDVIKQLNLEINRDCHTSMAIESIDSNICEPDGKISSQNSSVAFSGIPDAIEYVVEPSIDERIDLTHGDKFNKSVIEICDEFVISKNNILEKTRPSVNNVCNHNYNYNNMIFTMENCRSVIGGSSLSSRSNLTLNIFDINVKTNKLVRLIDEMMKLYFYFALFLTIYGYFINDHGIVVDVIREKRFSVLISSFQLYHAMTVDYGRNCRARWSITGSRLLGLSGISDVFGDVRWIFEKHKNIIFDEKWEIDVFLCWLVHKKKSDSGGSRNKYLENRIQKHDHISIKLVTSRIFNRSIDLLHIKVFFHIVYKVCRVMGLFVTDFLKYLRLKSWNEWIDHFVSPASEVELHPESSPLRKFQYTLTRVLI